MKKCFVMMCVMAAMLSACNSNEKKALEFSKELEGYVKGNNLEWLKTVYPTADFDSIGFANYVEPQVGESPEKGLIRIDFGESAWIDLKAKEDGGFEIVNSYGLAQFPAEKFKLAQETGMITPGLDDVEIQKRMNDRRYFTWLKNKANNIVEIKPGPMKWIPDYYSEGGWTSCVCQLTNTTQSPISGKDYIITYTYEYETCSDGSSPNGFANAKKPGVDLNPGETKSMTIKQGAVGLHNIAVQMNLPETQLAALLTPKGNEYEEFIKQYGEPVPADPNAPASPEACIAEWPSKMPESGSIEQFAWLSEYKLTPADLQNFSKAQLRLLRNAIYAMHGYIFQSQDLKDYFGKFAGYEPVSRVVPSFNSTESANIKLIQGFE